MVPLLKGVMCKACGTFKHTTKKCHTPKHLVALYHKSLGKENKAHFSIPTNLMYLVGCSSKDSQNLSTDELTLTVDDYMDLDNTMVEYASNDMFGVLL
jgi:hypothetical protein